MHGHEGLGHRDLDTIYTFLLPNTGHKRKSSLSASGIGILLFPRCLSRTLCPQTQRWPTPLRGLTGLKRYYREESVPIAPDPGDSRPNLPR